MPIDIGSNDSDAESCSIQKTSTWKKTVVGSVAIQRLRSLGFYQIISKENISYWIYLHAIMPVQA